MYNFKCERIKSQKITTFCFTTKEGRKSGGVGDIMAGAITETKYYDDGAIDTVIEMITKNSLDDLTPEQKAEFWERYRSYDKSVE
jgi:hypothetical protein